MKFCLSLKVQKLTVAKESIILLPSVLVMEITTSLVTVSNVSILIADTCINVSDSSACVETFGEEWLYMQISYVWTHWKFKCWLFIILYWQLHQVTLIKSLFLHLSLMCVRALFYSFQVVADLFENDHASTLGNHDCHKFTKRVLSRAPKKWWWWWSETWPIPIFHIQFQLYCLPGTECCLTLQPCIHLVTTLMTGKFTQIFPTMSPTPI